MFWGFECNDGWFDIIYDLSQKLEPYGVVAVQVKQKFGALRFYVDGIAEKNREAVYDLIELAEKKAFNICEFCGSQPAFRSHINTWMVTVCNECFKDTQRKKHE